MFSQRSADVPAAVILILLAVLQVKVDCKAEEQRVMKYTCPNTCTPGGNCYYKWYLNYYYSWSKTYVGCSYSNPVWLDSSRLSAQDTYTCEEKYTLPQQNCVLGNQYWGVTYTAEHICALKGSSVNFSCSYTHPEILTVTGSFWFTERLRGDGGEPQDVMKNKQYEGRVQYSRTPNDCMMTITDLREEDADTYMFRFYTDGPGGKYSGKPGVTLSVTGLKVTVSDTGEGVKKLTCSSTCTLPSSSTYRWYKNLQPVFNQNRDEVYLSDGAVDAGSYSCAVEGYEQLRSPAVCVFEEVLQVKVEGPAAAASEGQTVTLTCNSTCTLPSSSTYIWYRNLQPVSGCESASCSVAVVSEAVSYSCAVRGSDLRSPPVYSPKNTSVVILPSGQRVEGESVSLICSSDANPPVLTYVWFNQSSDAVLGTGQNYTITNISSQQSGLYNCTASNQLGNSSSGPSRLDVTSLHLDSNTENSSTVYTACGVVVVVVVVVVLVVGVVVFWRRRRSAVTSRASEENRGELSSAPVYEDVSSLAVISDLPEAVVSDDQDDVQYSSVSFSRFQMKEVPLYSSVRLTDAVREEEEVQYAAVNTAKPRAAGNDEPQIYSTVQKNLRR